MIKRVVMFSGGVSSWAAAKRVAQATDEPITLLFADTMMEDEDLYRFLGEAEASIERSTLVRIADGRNPWQVFFDERFLGNSQVDPCSKILKRQLLDKWRAENCDPAETITYVGVDWTEIHRYERLKERSAPWRVEAPLCDKPYLTKDEQLNWLRAEGIEPPRLYERGFHHNNCGGFCIKAGQAQFAALLREFPERYAYHEGKEQALREYLGKDVSILRDRTAAAETTVLTLRNLRERIEGKQAGQIDMFDWGGCGCYVDDEGSSS